MIIHLVTISAYLAIIANANEYIIYPNATALSPGIHQAANVYQSIRGPTFSWTFWLQLSSSNLNSNADHTIVSVTTGTGVFLSLFLSQGIYLSANYMTSLTTIETVAITSELPPVDGWFLMAFVMDSSNNQAKVAWRRANGTTIISQTRTMSAPAPPLPTDAALTLKLSSAQGYLNLATLYDTALTDNEVRSLGNNYPTNMQYVQGQLIGGTSFEFYGNMVLTCTHNDSVIVNIEFASYGRSTGLFPKFTRNPKCEAVSAQVSVEAICIGQKSCSIPVDNQHYGDPCPTQRKWMNLIAWCSSPSTASLSGGATLSPLPSTSGAASGLVTALQASSESALHTSTYATQSPPDIQDRNRLQNGYRVKVALALDVSSRSQSLNRVDARLAVRDICTVLLLSVSRFVLIDVTAKNRTDSILTFTILAGSTPAALADGLKIALSFREEIKNPDSVIRQGTLLSAAYNPISINIECVPLMRCQSGDYICLTESSCPSSATASGDSMPTAIVTTGVAASAAVLIAFGTIWCVLKRRRELALPPTVRSLPVVTSHNPFISRSAHDIFPIPGSFVETVKDSAGGSGDAAGFRLPRSGKHQNFRPGVGAALGVSTAPQGVANTISDLEQTLTTMD